MNDRPIVKVSEGLLVGRRAVTCGGQNYASFQGIPYAKPPLGSLRFKAPEPPEKWSGLREATKECPDCYAKTLFANQFDGSEDCLYLNIYTPKLSPKERLPVMFWIHGGGFSRGSGSTVMYGPDYLVERDVVLVTINYRLAVLGFLAFSNPEVGVAGNAGLKDIVMALKWVKKNIKYFGGDPKNVTIFGESAGGAAAHLLILSPMAKGLFHKAIMQSGSALNCFSRGQFSCTYELAHKLGIDSHNDKFILNELQKISVEELCKASSKIWDPFLLSYKRPFCPVIETKGGFLSEEPLDILKSGRYNRVPMIFGYNTMEGLFIYSLIKLSAQNFLVDNSLVPGTLNLRRGGPVHIKVATEIKAAYNITGKESIEVQKDLDKALRLYTHNFFFLDICTSAKLHLTKNHYPIYFYKFDLDTELNYMKMIIGLDVKGASHADDLGYLFTNELGSPPTEGTLEHSLMRKVTKMWTNFARCGDPTPPGEIEVDTLWKPMTSEKVEYLNMENEKFEMNEEPEKGFVEFWERVFHQHQVHLSKL